MKESSIILYETEEGKINIDVLLKDETIFRSETELDIYEIERVSLNTDTKTGFLTEWYINGSNFHGYQRRTERNYFETYCNNCTRV